MEYKKIEIEISSGLDLIGDIHGCYEEFLELLDKLDYKKNDEGLYIHPNGRKIVSLGDVMSRGPRSIDSIAFFKKHVDAKVAYMIDSNHGWKIARWLDGRKVTLQHGDEKVAEEFEEYQQRFGNEAAAKLKEEFRDLLLDAPSHYIFTYNSERVIVATHGGIKDHYIGKQSKTISDFCRYGDVGGFDENGKPIRKEWFLQHHSNELIIWGHDPKLEPLSINNTINIDQGVVFGGKLTAYRYPEHEFVFVKAKENYSGQKVILQ